MSKRAVLGAFIIGSLCFAVPVFAAEPVAHWKFDEGTGSTATDSSANGHDGTISGATYSTNVPDVGFEDPYSLDFDGEDDGVITPLSVDNYAEFTLAGWAYPRTATPSSGWFGANNAFEFIFQDATTLRCWTSVAAVNWSFEGVDDFLDAWHHITCLGNGDAVILYVDGTQVASTAHEHTDDYGGGDDFSIGIGVQNGGASGPFDGLIDDVRVYDVALTPGEMSSLGTGSDEPVDTPVVTALSPANGATDVALGADLSLTFSKDVGWESGTILIRKVDDDTIVETIQAGGGPVSGSGTATLAIHPHYDLEYDTEYYVEIPDTAVRDLDDGFYFAGIQGAGTWSFTTEKDEVAPVLTEAAAIPSQGADADDAVYYFRTDELCEVAVTPPTSDTGAVQPLAEEVLVGQDIGITLQGMKAGGTYSFSFTCIDGAGNESNALTVGPFTVKEASERSSGRGTSVQARVKNLLEMGNDARANELKAQYPNLFATSDGAPAPLAGIGMPVRDLTMSMTGDDVRALQGLLIAQGHAIPAGPTGYFFTQTRDALAAYQSAHSIAPAAGYFGPITRTQMKAAGMAGLWW